MPYKSKEARKNYQKKFQENRKKTHRPVKLTLSVNRYEIFEKQSKLEELSVPKMIEFLALATLEQTPFVSVEQKQRMDEMIAILRSCGTGVYQIAQSDLSEESVSTLLTNIYASLAQIEELIRVKLS